MVGSALKDRDVKELDARCQRPTSLWNERRAERRAPVFLVSGQQGVQQLLGQLAERWKATAMVPTARLRPGTETPTETARADKIESLLRDACHQLHASVPSLPLRFQRFSLAIQLLEWVNTVEAAKNNEIGQRRRALRKELRRRAELVPRIDARQDSKRVHQSDLILEALPAWGAGWLPIAAGVGRWANTLIAFILALLGLLATLVKAIDASRASGLLAIRRHRWLRQQFRRYGGGKGPLWELLLDLAPDLHEGTPQAGGDKEARRRWLLVNAFLEDLRQAYAHRPRNLTARERPTYPVLLLEDIPPETAGDWLLRTIVEVREETERWDPLLVVAGLDENVKSGQWQDGHYRQLGPIEVTNDTPRPALQGPPPYRRRFIAVTLTVLIAIGSAAYTVYDRWDHCVGWLEFATHAGIDRTWEREGAIDLVHPWNLDDQCIGITDGSYKFAEELAPEIAMIHEENTKAIQEDHATVIWMGRMDLHQEEPPENQPLSLTPELRGTKGDLRGVALAQRKYNEANTPKLRVLIANAGRRADHAQEVADRIVKLADAEGVVGVIGLGHSLLSLQEAVQTLTSAGLPMVSSTSTHDDMGRGSEFFHRVAPPNHVQAAMAAAYARQALEVTSAAILYEQGDLYAENLAKDFNSSFFGADGLDLREEGGYEPGANGNLNEEIGEICENNPDLIYFTGRAEQFETLLSLTQGDQCRDVSSEKPLYIMTGDDVGRYAADNYESIKRQPNIHVYYTALTYHGMWAEKRFDPALPRYLSSFERLYRDQRNRLAEIAKELGVRETASQYQDPDREMRRELNSGHVVMGHDATLAIASAVQQAAEAQNGTVPDKGAVWRALGRIHTSRTGGWAGGLVNFSDSEDPGTPRQPGDPQHKALVLLSIDPESSVTLIARCGYLTLTEVQRDDDGVLLDGCYAATATVR